MDKKGLNIINYILLVMLSVFASYLLNQYLELENFAITEAVNSTFIVVLILTLLITIAIQFVIFKRHLRSIIMLVLTFVIINVISAMIFTPNILNLVFESAFSLIIARNFLILDALKQKELIANMWSYVGFTLIIMLVSINVIPIGFGFLYLLINASVILQFDRKVANNLITLERANIIDTYFIIISSIIVLFII